MGSFHPDSIIGPVEELNIFQVDTDSEVDVRISNVKDPKTVFWVNASTNTFPNLRLLSEKENPDIEAPEKASLPGWKNFSCKRRHAHTITSKRIGNRNCEQDEVPKVWSVVPHSKKVSRRTDTHRSKKSCRLLRHSRRVREDGSMLWKDFANVSRIECPNTVQNKSPYEFLPMPTDICDKGTR